MNHKNLNKNFITSNIKELLFFNESKFSIYYHKNTYNNNYYYKYLKKISFKQSILKILKTSKCNFLSFFTNNDFRNMSRSSFQVAYMIKNNINISSCKSKPQLDTYDFLSFDKFATPEEIDSMCKSAFIPVDVFTLVINLKFLKSLMHVIEKEVISDELDFLLFLLKYSQIHKIDKVLYFPKKSQIPYKENLNLDLTKDSSNRIGRFLNSKYINNRSYLLSALNNSTIKTGSKNKTNIIFEKNILILIENLEIGGTETYLLSICKELKKINVNSIILYNTGIFSDILKINNIRCIYSKTIFFDFKSRNLIDSFNQLNSIITKNNISTLYVHTPLEIELAYEFKIYYPNIKIVATLHGLYYMHTLIKKVSLSIDTFILVSNSVFEYYKLSFFKLENIHILNNSISISDCTETKILTIINSTIITYCSRLSASKSKCVFLLLETIDALLQLGYDIKCFILGSGEHFNIIKDTASKINNKFGEKIYIKGFVYNVSDYYKNSHINIGTGRAAIESLVLSKPTIALGSSGYGGIINKSNAHLLLSNNFFDHGNIVNSNFSKFKKLLESDILKLINDSNFYSEISKFSKNFVNENLNISELAKKIEFLL